MSFAATIDASRLTVLLDVRLPLAYLALHPIAALARELGVEITWLPLEAQPLRAPTSPQTGDDRGVRHRRYRAQAIAREIETYAAAQGLLIRDYYRAPDPAALHLGWLWLRDHNPERLWPFLVEVFRSYWALELDPSDEVAIAALVESLDGDGQAFRSWCGSEGRMVAAELAEALRARGLSAAPSYLVEGERFIGRQHLPMIRWILQGREGAGPI